MVCVAHGRGSYRGAVCTRKGPSLEPWLRSSRKTLETAQTPPDYDTLSTSGTIWYSPKYGARHLVYLRKLWQEVTFMFTYKGHADLARERNT